MESYGTGSAALLRWKLEASIILKLVTFDIFALCMCVFFPRCYFNTFNPSGAYGCGFHFTLSYLSCSVRINCCLLSLEATSPPHLMEGNKSSS